MTVTISAAERKRELGYGDVRAIAAAVGVHPSYVSKARHGALRPTTPAGRRQLRRIQVAIARRLGARVDTLFPPS